MLTDRKILGKLEQIENRYAQQRFERIADVCIEMGETRQHYRTEPGGRNGIQWEPAPPDTKWGEEWGTAWFRGDVKLPRRCVGHKVFVRARTGVETLFLVDGHQAGVFDGNHPVVLMTMSGVSGRKYHLAFEAYAGHATPGCSPNDNPPPPVTKARTFGGVEILLEREDVTAFVFDLKVLRLLVRSLDENSLRRNTVVRELAKVFALVDAMPVESGEASWRPKLEPARQIMQPLLAAVNGSTVPQFGIIGHSHIDTAWLWPLAESWRKCARTFSSTLSLMEQYPEFLFIQSQPCQTEMMRREYPDLFARMQKMVAAGRWEPNGAMWVEPDCNIPSGEAFVRQLLVGQQATREFFGYTADTLWLPDVFGYSAALPQILRGAGVEFFCTTKIAWNDTTRFPYDTFSWKGIDGSAVLAHFNSIHCWPDPETLAQQWNWVQHKDVQDRRLCAFGYGDGGGGPMAEMLEVARRLENLEGCPRAEYSTVSDFMKGVRDELTDLPAWNGELYLEYHRGTLTSIARIKRGNRKTEFALRDAEFLSTLAALAGADYPAAALRSLWKTLLTNQFHDILPGSSIAEVNDEAIADFDRCAAEARVLSAAGAQALAGAAPGAVEAVFISNSLSWDRTGEVVLEDMPDGVMPAGKGVIAQRIQDPAGQEKLIVSGLTVPALGAAVLRVQTRAAAKGPSPFKVSGDTVDTPHLRARFDAAGGIVSLVLKASGREAVKPGGVLNAFLAGEDIPEAWDNWDIDREQRLKMRAAGQRLSRKIVTNGPLQLRLRSEYRLGSASRILQDMVLHAGTPQVDFETVIHWQEKHTLLKAAFDVDVLADFARHEIQYGFVERPTHTNLPQDRARFEACAHKWVDLADNGFGVALLNDCKYGVGVMGSTVTLSLLKSGTHPDSRGDAGEHRVTYSLLPHDGPFSVEAVVRPAYELNVPVTVAAARTGAASHAALATVDAANVIIESVKWAEQGRAFVLRLYDAGKIGRQVRVTFGTKVRKVSATNLLEEGAQPLKLTQGQVSFFLRPFEIKTLRCEV